MCVERVGGGEGAYVCGVVGGGWYVWVWSRRGRVCVCVGGVMWRGMYVGGREVAYMCRGGGAYVCAGYECGGGGGDGMRVEMGCM